MSCYHPFIGIDTGDKTGNGKRKLKIVSLEKNDDYKKIVESGSVLIPCGHCIGCRLDYSRRWADRMMLELETAKKAIFVTLTYSNEFAPWSMFDENDVPLFASLDKRDCQLFMKRLRKCFSDVKIRFYLAGEYGNVTLRPHYHCIIYGIGLSDIDDLRIFGRNELKQAYYVSDRFTKIWNKGHVLIADVSWETCAYVARYVTKKLNGERGYLSYASRNVIPEFSLMSRKPGIGKRYLEENPDCLDYEYINISTPTGGRKIPIPKIFLEYWLLTDEEKFNNIMRQRQKYCNDKMFLQLRQTDLTFSEYLETKEEIKLSKVKSLKRRG